MLSIVILAIILCGLIYYLERGWDKYNCLGYALMLYASFVIGLCITGWLPSEYKTYETHKLVFMNNNYTQVKVPSNYAEVEILDARFCKLHVITEDNQKFILDKSRQIKLKAGKPAILEVQRTVPRFYNWPLYKTRYVVTLPTKEYTIVSRLLPNSRERIE